MQLRFLLKSILKESYEVSDIETAAVNTNEKLEYSDVLDGTNYKLIQKVTKGTASPLAFDLIGGKRIGDFGEQKLKAYAKSGISPSGIGKNYNPALAEDTNTWVDTTLYSALAPSAVGGAITGRPGGSADSVGADLWIPTMAGWEAYATASVGVLNLTLCGAAYSMKMSAATTQAGDETVQPTKFVTEQGIADVGYLIVYKYLYENNLLGDTDRDKLTSTSGFKDVINKKLIAMNINTVKYNGGAANGSLAKSTEITDKIQKNLRIKLEGMKDRDGNVIQDATITFGTVAYLLNTLVSTANIANGFESASTTDAKISYLKNEYTQDKFYRNYKTITRSSTMTYAVGDKSRAVKFNSTGPKNKEFYDAFWAAAKSFLDKFSNSNINPTLAISFRSCKPVEYTLELPTKPARANAKQPDLQYTRGSLIQATKSGLPEEDALMIFGKYADSAYPFIRSMSSVFGDLAPGIQLIDQQQRQEDFNLQSSQDASADVDASRIQSQQAGEDLNRQTPASGLDDADRLVARVRENSELKTSIEGIIRIVIANYTNFQDTLTDAAKHIFLDYNELFANTVGTVDPLVKQDAYLANVSKATQDYLDQILTDINSQAREREAKTRRGFFARNNERKAFEAVWSTAITNIQTVTTLSAVKKPDGTISDDLTTIKNKLELIRDELRKGRIVKEEIGLDFVGFKENKINSHIEAMLEQMYSIQTILSVMNEISEYLISKMNIDITLSYNDYLNKSLEILQPLTNTKSKKSVEYKDNVNNIPDFRKDIPMGGEDRTAAALNTNSNKPILMQVPESKIYESILRELMKYSN